MRHYFIYLLEPEIANSYYGKEQLIYQLFSQGEIVNNPLTKIVEKQIRYISQAIPSLQLNKHLDFQLKNRKDYYVSDERYYVNSKTLKSKAVLAIHPHLLSLTVTGSYHAETTFFEVLRKFDPCFFALDFENNNYGWLTPVKQVKYI